MANAVGHRLTVKGAQMSFNIAVLVMPWCLLALAVILAVIRVDRADLLDVVRAIMGRNDDGDGPPSLPEP